MSNELIYLRFLQISMVFLTFALGYSIFLAVKGKIELHKTIMSIVLSITAVAVVGLLVTVFVFGFDYQSIKLSETLFNIGPDDMSLRLNIHRLFSCPLLIGLIWTGYTGVNNMAAQHKKSLIFTLVCWAGTAVTAIIFF